MGSTLDDMIARPTGGAGPLQLSFKHLETFWDFSKDGEVASSDDWKELSSNWQADNPGLTVNQKKNDVLARALLHLLELQTLSELTNLVLYSRKEGNVGEKGQEAMGKLVEFVV